MDVMDSFSEVEMPQSTNDDLFKVRIYIFLFEILNNTKHREVSKGEILDIYLVFQRAFRKMKKSRAFSRAQLFAKSCQKERFNFSESRIPRYLSHQTRTHFLASFQLFFISFQSPSFVFISLLLLPI